MTAGPIGAVRRVVVAGTDHGAANAIVDGPSPPVHTLTPARLVTVGVDLRG